MSQCNDGLGQQGSGNNGVVSVEVPYEQKHGRSSQLATAQTWIKRTNYGASSG